jgi:NAD-dependent DNA ligase
VIRSGEVIPYVLGPIKERRPENCKNKNLKVEYSNDNLENLKKFISDKLQDYIKRQF